MKRILGLLFLMSSFVFSQSLCEQCVEQNGFYCGDDPTNWTQYAPNGCVPNGLNGLYYLNDGWEDCIDGSDEQDAIPTTATNCDTLTMECDTVYVDVIEYINLIDTIEIEVPFYIYETIIETDTVYNIEYITQIVVDTIIEEVEVLIPEYIYVTDTIYAEILDTLFIDIVEYIEIETIIFDTIIETEYVEFFITDTIVEYQTITITEYIDCDSGLPCNSGMQEAIEKSKTNGLIYNMMGQAIKNREGVYIENGQINYRLK